MFNDLGRIFIGLGIFLIIIGVVFLLNGKISWLGRLPGDIYIKKEGFTLFIPITTSLLISLILSLIFRIFR